MVEIFNDWCNLMDNIFYPMFILLSWIQLPELPAGSFDGVVYVFSLFAFFYDATIFPVWFSFTITAFIFSMVISWVVSLVRLIVDLIPLY